MDPEACKGRVVDVALRGLQTRGWGLTTFADIARDAGLAEADVYALFTDEEALMAELVAPLMHRLRQVVVSAVTADLRRPLQVRQVIEGYLDALVAHRPLVGLIQGDPTAATSASVRLVRGAVEDLRNALAQGTGSDLEHRIRAASALGAVQAAVLELTDIDPATVGSVIAEAAVAILLS